jgi:DNA-binding response OmpR family regulator
LNDLVLLVDDAPEVGLLVQRYAKHGGYALHWCERGEGAPALVAERLPRLVLIDINLPGMNGLDLCRQLASGPGGRPLLAVFSHWDRPAEVEAALDAGADCIVTKELLRRPADWQERLGGLLAVRQSGRDSRFSIPIRGLGEACLKREYLPALEESLHEVPLRLLGAEITDLLVRRAARDAGVSLPSGAPLVHENGMSWPESLRKGRPPLAWANGIAVGIWRLLGVGPAAAYLEAFRQGSNQVHCEWPSRHT